MKGLEKRREVRILFLILSPTIRCCLQAAKIQQQILGKKSLTLADLKSDIEQWKWKRKLNNKLKPCKRWMQNNLSLADSDLSCDPNCGKICWFLSGKGWTLIQSNRNSMFTHWRSHHQIWPYNVIIVWVKWSLFVLTEEFAARNHRGKQQLSLTFTQLCLYL